MWRTSTLRKNGNNTIKEYFDKWLKVLDEQKIRQLSSTLIKEGTSRSTVESVFRQFHICPYDNLRIVLLTADSKVFQYPFLDIIKESLINLEIPHNHIIFDDSLEKWHRQGVLHLSAALPCQCGREASYIWKDLIKSLLHSLAKQQTAIVYMLVGYDVHSFRQCINSRLNHIISIPVYREHRKAVKAFSDAWKKADSIMTLVNGDTVQWYSEQFN